MSWYQEGLVIDLGTLAGDGAMRAMFLDDGYAFDDTDGMAEVSLVESSGGAYARVDVDDVVVDLSMPTCVRLLTTTPLSIRRPASAFGWLVLYRAADDVLVLAVPVSDNLGDPVEMHWVDDVIGVRVVAD